MQYVVRVKPSGNAKDDSAEILKCQEADYALIERTTIVLDHREADRFLAALDDPASFEVGVAALTDRPSVIE